jgi:hypothetical protein
MLLLIFFACSLEKDNPESNCQKVCDGLYTAEVILDVTTSIGDAALSNAEFYENCDTLSKLNDCRSCFQEFDALYGIQSNCSCLDNYASEECSYLSDKGDDRYTSEEDLIEDCASACDVD